MGRTEITRSTFYASWAMSGLVILFLVFDAAIKLAGLNVVTESMDQLGYGTNLTLARGLGILLLVCTAIYAFPRKSVLGAILLTGYLGGAIATQLRVGNPVFSHLLFGAYLGLLLWGGMYLRNEKLRALVPFT